MDKKLSGKEKELVSISATSRTRQTGISSSSSLPLPRSGAGSQPSKRTSKSGSSPSISWEGRGICRSSFTRKDADDMKRPGKYLSAVIYSDRALFASFAADLDDLESAMQELKGEKNNLVAPQGKRRQEDPRSVTGKGAADGLPCPTSGRRSRRTSRRSWSWRPPQKKLSALIERLQIERGETGAREAKEKRKD